MWTRCVLGGDITANFFSLSLFLVGDITADFISLFYDQGMKTLQSWNLMIEWLISSIRTKDKNKILAGALGHQGQCYSGRCFSFSSLEKDPHF